MFEAAIELVIEKILSLYMSIIDSIFSAKSIYIDNGRCNDVSILWIYQ